MDQIPPIMLVFLMVSNVPILTHPLQITIQMSGRIKTANSLPKKHTLRQRAGTKNIEQVNFAKITCKAV